MTLPASARDAALLVARVIVGIVLIAHGARKFFSYGIGGTATSFTQMGVRASSASAVFAAVVELVGGAALLLGAATVVASSSSSSTCSARSCSSTPEMGCSSPTTASSWSR
jgi:putative oxidoreductase